MIITSFITILIAYLVGSIPSAVLVSRFMDLPDPRTKGSGNPGATNMLRLGGKKPALFTFLSDMLKGLQVVGAVQFTTLPPFAVAGATIAVFLGHLFPIFAHFKGGKGVATYLGILLAFSPFSGMCWLIVWGVVAALFRYASLASLVASLLTPLYLWFFTNSSFKLILLMFLVLLLIW